ncbi:unnamed protein product [Bursaphelenchus xylophilus]|uniref:(pine wood nematode) hypothetical protein n=1 Tax=Bursaphelenchus xylophilus TaxID=6326 RepID=A0A1I7SW10_BURXY|nr:unnamed protein product [Bursaphelenchus xylophilus]CAG9098630.1 unnamed protein product [Bursaphelenchus xylophilus]
MRIMYMRVAILLTLMPIMHGQQVEPTTQPEAPSSTPEIVNQPGKRRQYVGAPLPPPPGELLAPAPPPPVGPTGQCPGGPSLPIECDPKRPWPQCPPQSYCYATNSVDIGPYFCCPVWSTYGAAWRPATPFFDYVPPKPYNWGPGPPPPPPVGFAAPALAPPHPAPIPAAYPAPLPVKSKRTIKEEDEQ